MTLDPRILAGARRAFGRHGYSGATLELIAREAGLSRVTLHRRGITKESLLGALAEAATEDYRHRMWPVLTDTAPAPVRLRRAVEAVCDAAEEHMSLLLALSPQSDAVFHDEGEERLTRSTFTEPLERLLHEGQAEGSVAPGDVAERATVLFNLVGWTYIHLRTGHGWPPARARAAVTEIALEGVLAR